MNKKSSLTLVLMFLITLVAFGQHKDGNKERIKQLKVAHLTEQLDLSSSEAEAFWPIYNAHEKAMLSYRKSEKEAQSVIKSDAAAALSELEAGKALNKLLTIKQEKHQERISYMKKVRKVLSSKKTLLLIKAEEGFNRRLLKQMREKRNR